MPLHWVTLAQLLRLDLRTSQLNQFNILKFLDISQMNLLVISMLAVASMSLLPSRVDGGAPSTDVKASVAAAAPATGEIWQEDDREVLIRNVRGAKNNKDAQTGTASGKKGGKNRKNGGHNKPKEPVVGQHHRQHKNNKQNKSTNDETNRKTHFYYFLHNSSIYLIGRKYIGFLSGTLTLNS